MYKNVIFDLDGTLLDTLDDMLDAVNMTLKVLGYDYEFNRKLGKYLYGTGVDYLVKKAVSIFPYMKEEEKTKFKEVYSYYYRLYSNRKTTVYPTMLDTLIYLKSKGIKLFVISNKPDDILKRAISKFFGNALFDQAVGKKENTRIKPDPSSLLMLMDEYDLAKNETVYVGDTKVDIKYAHGASIRCVGASYGYRSTNELIYNNADYIIDKPNELISIVFAKNN